MRGQAVNACMQCTRSQCDKNYNIIFAVFMGDFGAMCWTELSAIRTSDVFWKNGVHTVQRRGH